jgi:hypothetical protein
MLTLLRTVFFIVIGWYLVKWLVRWLSGGGGGTGDIEGPRRDEEYGDLTDQKIDDADYEDL